MLRCSATSSSEAEECETLRQIKMKATAGGTY